MNESFCVLKLHVLHVLWYVIFERPIILPSSKDMRVLREFEIVNFSLWINVKPFSCICPCVSSATNWPLSRIYTTYAYSIDRWQILKCFTKLIWIAQEIPKLYLFSSLLYPTRFHSFSHGNFRLSLPTQKQYTHSPFKSHMLYSEVDRQVKKGIVTAS